MTSKEKIEYFLNEIRERARISPVAAFHLPVAHVLGSGLAILLSENEQRELLQKFQVDGLLWVIEQDETGAWLALMKDFNIDSDDSPYAGSASGTQLPNVRSMKTDLEQGLISIDGKPVQVSRGKENNALRLLKTLSKEPGREWFEDEILADWEGENVDVQRIPRNRVYHAARHLNIKLDTGANIKDFIEHDTSKYRINPVYLRHL